MNEHKYHKIDSEGEDIDGNSKVEDTNSKKKVSDSS
jgi:hypothetical protein